MTKRSQGKALSRRHFFKLTGGSTLFAAGMGLLPFKNLLGPLSMADASAQAVTVNPPPDLYFGGTDGWISLPKNPEVRSASLGGVKTHPDDLAPIDLDTADGKGLTTYIFGFRNVTGLSDTQRAAQKNHAQHSAPMFWLDQFNPASPKDFRINLTNLGLALRPDLFDAHTIHWHGFRNVITFFDGEPTGSIAVTAGRVFQYVYRPRDPGTYMFHCHVEDVEHVQMGMTGVVYVRPTRNTSSQKYAYDHASTAYTREFAFMLTELWAEGHYRDAHIQTTDWTDYRPSFWLMNGRAYPDTLKPSTDPLAAGADPLSDSGESLRYNPISSLVRCNAGDKVLLRIANLGYQHHAMTLDGIPMTVVAKDASPLVDSTVDLTYQTNTVEVGPGESRDVIFTAPANTGSAPVVYRLYDRNYAYLNNGGGSGYGGQMTEVRVYPAGTLGPQARANA